MLWGIFLSYRNIFLIKNSRKLAEINLFYYFPLRNYTENLIFISFLGNPVIFVSHKTLCSVLSLSWMRHYHCIYKWKYIFSVAFRTFKSPSSIQASFLSSEKKTKSFWAKSRLHPFVPMAVGFPQAQRHMSHSSIPHQNSPSVTDKNEHEMEGGNIHILSSWWLLIVEIFQHLPKSTFAWQSGKCLLFLS